MASVTLDHKEEIVGFLLHIIINVADIDPVQDKYTGEKPRQGAYGFSGITVDPLYEGKG